MTGHLLKILGLAFGLAVLVGNTIGMGILRTPGEVAAALPSVPLFMGVWVVGALYALLGALTVAELGAMEPRSGGLYPLATLSLGPFPGFVVGWTDWLGTSGSMAAIAMVVAQYLGPLVPALAGHETATALAVIAGFGMLQWFGIRVGDLVQQATSLLKALALLALAAVAWFAVQPLSVGITDPQPAAGVPVGLAFVTAVIVALQSVIYTYDGWTGPVYFGDELKHPERDIPRSMIGGVLVVLAIYLALNAAFLRVVPIAEMAGDPFVASTVAMRLFGARGELILRALTILSLLAAVNAILLMATRIPYAMGRNGLLPRVVGRVNRGGTPDVAMVLSLLLAGGVIVSNTFDAVLALLAFFFVANYAMVFVGFFRLRLTQPERRRPFRVPLYPWVPSIALAGSLAFLVAALWSDRGHSLIALLLVGISWPVFRFTRQHSR